jgi:hypothetical protein
MYKIFCNFLFILTIQMTVHSYAQSFEFIYSTANDDVVNDAVEDSAGNFYLVGGTGQFNFNYPHYSGLIIKLNVAGDTLKTLVLPPTGDGIHFSTVTRLNDSLFIAFGEKEVQGTNDWQILFLKFDNNLNIIDEKTFGDTIYNEHIFRAKISSQNEFLLVGYASNAADYQLIFYRSTLNGDSLQSFYLGQPNNWEFGDDILETPDSTGYLIFSFGWPAINPAFHNEILKLNMAGNVDTVVEISFSREVITAKWISDSTFITSSSGFNPFIPPYDWDLRIHQYDINLNLLFDTLLGPPDTNEIEANNGLDFIVNNKIFVGGTSNYQNLPFMPDPAYYYLIQFNNTLIPQWEKYISLSDDYLNLNKVLATNDGGVLLAGTKYNDQTSGSNERDIYVVKLDSLGNFTTGINIPTAATQVHDVIVYPNPAHNIINIRSTINFPATEIILYDASGREVMNKKISSPERTSGGAFSVKQLSEGIYFYKIKDAKGKEERGKIVKE